MNIVQLKMVLGIVIRLIIIVMYIPLLIIIFPCNVVFSIFRIDVYRTPLPGYAGMLVSEYVYEPQAIGGVSPGG